jgi:hypothetical protein
MKSRSTGSPRLKHETLAIVGSFVATLTLFLPSTVHLTDSVEFSNTYRFLLLTSLCLGVALALSMFLGLFILKRISQTLLVRSLALLFALTCLVWLQGNFLLWPYGVLDGREIPWKSMSTYGFVDGSIWLAVIVAALVASRRVLRVAPRACALLVAVQLVYCGILIAGKPEVPSFKRYAIDEREKFVFSQQKNVIVLVLDSLATGVFMEVVRQSPAAAKPFDGFTHFRNSLGSFPFTELSVASMLTGRCYDNSMPFEEWKRVAFTSQSLPKVLKSAGWRVDVFPKLSFSLYYSEDIASNLVRGLSFRERLRDVAPVYDVALFRAVPHFLRRLVYNNQEWVFRRLLERFLADSQPERPKRDAIPRVLRAEGSAKPPTPRARYAAHAYGSSDAKFVDAALSESTIDTTRPAFKFYHWSGAHVPLTLNEKLRYEPMEVNRPNHIRTATAVLELTGVFLDHLRALGIYENSLIFVVGDHGPGVQGVPFVLQPGMRLEAGAGAVVEPFKTAALPLILVKPFGAKGPLVVSDAPVSLIDIPATVFASLGMTAETQGVSMFALSETQARRRRFYNYSEQGYYSYYGDMTEFLIDGYGWQDTSWQRSGRVLTKNGVVWRRTPAVGQELLFGDHAALDVFAQGFHHVEYAGKTPFHWTDGAASIRVPIDSTRRPTTLSLGVMFPGEPGMRLQVLLDECEVASESIPGEGWSKDIPLGHCAPTGRWTTIRFLSETVRPGSDRRSLGVALTRVVLR